MRYFIHMRTIKKEGGLSAQPLLLFFTTKSGHTNTDRNTAGTMCCRAIRLRTLQKTASQKTDIQTVAQSPRVSQSPMGAKRVHRPSRYGSLFFPPSLSLTVCMINTRCLGSHPIAQKETGDYQAAPAYISSTRTCSDKQAIESNKMHTTSSTSASLIESTGMNINTRPSGRMINPLGRASRMMRITTIAVRGKTAFVARSLTISMPHINPFCRLQHLI